MLASLNSDVIRAPNGEEYASAVKQYRHSTVVLGAHPDARDSVLVTAASVRAVVGIHDIHTDDADSGPYSDVNGFMSGAKATAHPGSHQQVTTPMSPLHYVSGEVSLRRVRHRDPIGEHAMPYAVPSDVALHGAQRSSGRSARLLHPAHASLRAAVPLDDETLDAVLAGERRSPLVTAARAAARQFLVATSTADQDTHLGTLPRRLLSHQRGGKEPLLLFDVSPTAGPLEGKLRDVPESVDSMDDYVGHVEPGERDDGDDGPTSVADFVACTDRVGDKDRGNRAAARCLIQFTRSVRKDEGLREDVLDALHPEAMAAIAEHSAHGVSGLVAVASSIGDEEFQAALCRLLLSMHGPQHPIGDQPASTFYFVTQALAGEARSATRRCLVPLLMSPPRPPPWPTCLLFPGSSRRRGEA